MPETTPRTLDLPRLLPLITEEWPSLDAATLEATGGDLEALVGIIAGATDHTRALIRQQLGELEAVAAGGVKRPGLGEIDAILDRLEAQTRKMVEQVQGTVLPAAEEKARENLGKSLLTALGLGFLIGLIFGGFGRGR